MCNVFYCNGPSDGGPKPHGHLAVDRQRCAVDASSSTHRYTNAWFMCIACRHVSSSNSEQRPRTIPGPQHPHPNRPSYGTLQSGESSYGQGAPVRTSGQAQDQQPRQYRSLQPREELPPIDEAIRRLDDRNVSSGVHLAGMRNTERERQYGAPYARYIEKTNDKKR